MDYSKLPPSKWYVVKIIGEDFVENYKSRDYDDAWSEFMRVAVRPNVKSAEFITRLDSGHVVPL